MQVFRAANVNVTKNVILPYQEKHFKKRFLFSNYVNNRFLILANGSYFLPITTYLLYLPSPSQNISSHYILKILVL